MSMHQPQGARARRSVPAGLRTLMALLLGLLLTACGGVGTPGDPNGEWTGTLVTDKGRCPDRTAARLLVDGRDISFIPTSGVLVLHGRRPAGDPRLHAQLALVDMNKKPLPMVFEGRLAADGTRIDGTYGTPSCRAHVVLVRPADHPLSRAFGN